MWPLSSFASTFRIVAKFPQQKSGSNLPYFRGEDLAAFRLRCVVIHETLFSPSFHYENMARKMPYFHSKNLAKFQVGAL